ncbi:MarR family transcriptional regulator [Pseudomonas sp. PA15(2017)]|uniref:DUF488 domain-containing protein n=1 Tax=Pseudomonas sp. PA15(2017) TaxID=1932111 RepID=UPI0009660E5E|nr:DUF488 family protein [Pseudomonas sp. PA15(2017)]OLU28671.1 MarR family transcriptional regulator [Pseudomonas sp. PA15(2017)]
MICCKRVYEPAEDTDGYRVLVDRLWPRGVSKAGLQHHAWLREVAPSTALRRAFGHRVGAFEAFSQGYRRELAAHPEHWQGLLARAGAGSVTLLYAARDQERNNARVLQDFLEDELDRQGASSSPVCYAGEL